MHSSWRQRYQWFDTQQLRILRNQLDPSGKTVAQCHHRCPWIADGFHRQLGHPSYKGISKLKPARDNWERWSTPSPDEMASPARPHLGRQQRLINDALIGAINRTSVALHLESAFWHKVHITSGLAEHRHWLMADLSWPSA
jgi:hypothetical protein